MKYSGKIWRHIPEGAHPLHIGFVLKARGRWNRAGEYGCLYASFTEEGAEAEYLKYLRQANIAPENATGREITSLIIEIEPVADLTDPRSSPISIRAAYLTGDSPEDLKKCQALADYLRTQGYAGIITPSASLSGEKNLVIYVDGPPKNLSLKVGGDRILI